LRLYGISILGKVKLAEACSILSSSDSTVAGDNLLLRALTIAPATLNSRSTVVDVTGILRYFDASLRKDGYASALLLDQKLSGLCCRTGWKR
jgi:hypothetical protein